MARRAVKKTYNLPPDLIARAKRVLKARTETEAIVRSLREVAFLDDVEQPFAAPPDACLDTGLLEAST